MANQDFAQKFSLNPPSRGKQFRVEFAKTRATERRATRKLSRVLEERATALSSAGVEAEPLLFSQTHWAWRTSPQPLEPSH
jgi:hypothetical protein